MSQKMAPPTRKHYPKKKRLMYEELQRVPTEYTVIALSKMTKVRAAQLMMIRKKFRNDIKIKIIKNKVATRAFENVKGVAGLENLSNQLEGQCALIFTNINPFKLNLIFAQRKLSCHRATRALHLAPFCQSSRRQMSRLR